MDHETCDACRFDGSVYDDAALVEAIRELGHRWRALLATAGDEMRTRPAPEVWSALEYAAHSRDITAMHVLGVDYALTTDNAKLPAIDAGALAEEAAATYAAEDPTDVLDALARETHRLADLGTSHPAGWHRTLTIGDAEGTPVRRMLEHALHDSVHHLDDVERGLAKIRDR